MNAPYFSREESSRPEIPAIVWQSLALLITAVAYVSTLQFDFVFDDVTLIENNPALRSWRFVPGYFLHHLWQGTAIPGNFYRPLLLLWLRVNYAAFGLHAAWWHATTVLVHLVATLMVFKLAERLSKNLFVAATAAAVFGLHPVHLQVVAWVSGVSESLCAVFFIGALLVYLREDLSRPLRLAMVSLLFGMSLLSKETGVVLPGIIFCLAWAREKSLSKAVADMVPLLVVAGAYLAIRDRALAGMLHASRTMPLTTILLSAPALVMRYLRFLVFPFKLTLFYDFAAVNHASAGFWMALSGLLGGAGLAAWWHWRARNVLVLLGCALLILPLLPVLNLRLFDPGEFVADRYLYLPSVGFALLLAFALERIMQNERARAAAVVTIGLVFLGGTVVQSQYWANDLVLANHALEMAPDNPKAKIDLGVELAVRGKNEQAVALFKDVLVKDSSNQMAAFNLGYTYFRMGEFENAEPHLRHSALSSPSANGCLIYGETELALGKLSDSEKALQCSVVMNPQCSECQQRLAEVREKLRQQVIVPGR